MRVPKNCLMTSMRVSALEAEIERFEAKRVAYDPADIARALQRATRFGRFRAGDVRSILAIGPAAPEPADAGNSVVVELPAVEVRGLDAYRIDGLA